MGGRPRDMGGSGPELARGFQVERGVGRETERREHLVELVRPCDKARPIELNNRERKRVGGEDHIGLVTDMRKAMIESG